MDEARDGRATGQQERRDEGQGPRRPRCWTVKTAHVVACHKGSHVRIVQSLARFRDCLREAFAGCLGVKLRVVTRVGMGEGHWPKRESGEPPT